MRGGAVAPTRARERIAIVGLCCALGACAGEPSAPTSAVPPEVSERLDVAAREAAAADAAPGIGQARERAAEATLAYAVLDAIAAYPEAAGPIVAEAVGRSPAHAPAIRTAALKAYPALGDTIARAAAAPAWTETPAAPLPPEGAAPVLLAQAEGAAPAWPAGEAGEGAGWPLGISELWLGAAAHDVGVFGHSKEDSGPDVDFGVRFAALRGEFWDLIANPRPHGGFNVSTSGDTSQMFGGLSWSLPIWRGFYFGADFGLALHDGKLTSSRTDKKELGLRILFREAAELGYQVDEHHGVSVFLTHISNASLGDANDGLDNVGVRYTYRP